jgi:hypothetical protein
MTIQGYAQTGTADAVFSYGGTAYGPYYGIGDLVYGVTSGSGSTVNVVVYNAYSNAEVDNIPFTVVNDGTVPVMFTSAVVTNWNGYPASAVAITLPAGQVNVGASATGFITIKLAGNFNDYVTGGGDEPNVATISLSYVAAQ